MKLQDDLFYLIVYGPGVGESIVLRDPSGAFIVVDSCSYRGKSFPAACLQEHASRWAAVILTHRHLDHADGLDQVLDSPGTGPVGCADPMIVDPEAALGSTDAGAQRKSAKVEHVLAAIRKRWRTHPASEWRMRRGDERTIVDTTLRVLHPDEETVAARWREPNRIATAILVTWRGLRLLLGSDTVAEDWPAISAAYPSLSDSQAVKVPHHGSRGAIDECWGLGHRDRLWVCTPFSTHGLPRYGDADGLAWALQHIDQVHLTGLPVAHQLQGPAPYRTTRSALRDGLDPPRATVSLSEGVQVAMQADPGSTEACFVAAGFRPDGTLADLQHGPGSVVVYETLPVEETDPQPVEAA